MKRNLLFVVIMAFSASLFAQEREGKTYRIIKGNSHQEISKYKTAFEKAKWDCYRTKDKARKIEFDNGICFELLSAAEAIKNGINVPTNCLTNPNDIISSPVYSLHNSGVIMEAVKPYSSSKLIKSIKQDSKGNK